MRTLFLLLFATSMCFTGGCREVEGEGGIQRPPLDPSTLPANDPTDKEQSAPPG